jgi:hypothetical protein
MGSHMPDDVPVTETCSHKDQNIKKSTVVLTGTKILFCCLFVE